MNIIASKLHMQRVTIFSTLELMELSPFMCMENKRGGRRGITLRGRFS